MAHEIRAVFEIANRFVMVGIGGAGMSGVARLLHNQGHEIVGSDAADSHVVAALRDEGIEVSVGPGPVEFETGDVLVVTDAVNRDEHPSTVAANRQGIPIVRRSEVLGWLLKDNRTIAITGSHGKTTTTGYTGKALEAIGLDPLVVVGAEVPAYGSSVRLGGGEFAVAEACEAYDSLRDFDPYIAVLTNLEFDHSHTHASFEELEKCVRRFLERVPADGCILVSESYRGLTVLEGLSQRIVSYSDKDFPEGVELKLPGVHNRENAAAALKVLEMLGKSGEEVANALAEFDGAERRLEVKFVDEQRDVTIYDDYAHHPTEIVASVTALRERHPESRIVVVYEPHMYSRTRDFLTRFVSALDLADYAVLTDIYPARENRIPGVTSFLIQEKLSTKSRYVPSLHLLAREIAPDVRDGDVVVLMGAGNINLVTQPLIAELKRISGGEAKRVAVIAGGDSAEREISLSGADEVASALTKLGYVVSRWDPAERLHSGKSIAELVGIERPDLAFLVMHGRRGEDGAIQGMLEMLHVPYTGSGVLSSAAAMDKSVTRGVLHGNGIRVPRGVLVQDSEVEIEFEPPYYVKPCRQGSTVGGSRVTDLDQLATALERAFLYDDAVLVEELVDGIEISCTVLDGEALPCVEIVPSSGEYDFAMKYQIGATEEICPARILESVEQSARDIAVRSYSAMGCRGLARVDMIIDQDEQPVVLEINTIPGMTSTSLVRKSAEGAGMTFIELVDRMVKSAIGEA